MNIYLKAFLALLVVTFFTVTFTSKADDLDLENTLYIDLVYGRVVIKMFPEVAPNHVAKIKKLTRDGFYDGSIFHRVIEGFMAQVGAPKGEITGGTGELLDAEFSDLSHYKGMVSMARPGDINAADSQFFIMTAYVPGLDGEYTIWGEVVSGMRYVDKIKLGEGPDFKNPDIIIKMQIAADTIK